MSNKPNMTEDERRAVLSRDIVVVPNRRAWAVIDTRRRHVEDGSNPLPVIVYSSLESREAADLARDEEIALEADGRGLCSEVPESFFNVAGRMLAYLNAAGTKERAELAKDMASNEPWDRPYRSFRPRDPDEIPF